MRGWSALKTSSAPKNGHSFVSIFSQKFLCIRMDRSSLARSPGKQKQWRRTWSEFVSWSPNQTETFWDLAIELGVHRPQQLVTSQRVPGAGRRVSAHARWLRARGLPRTGRAASADGLYTTRACDGEAVDLFLWKRQSSLTRSCSVASFYHHPVE